MMRKFLESKFSLFCALTSLVLSIAVLVGWKINSAFLKSFDVAMITTKANTAAGLLLLSFSLLFVRRSKILYKFLVIVSSSAAITIAGTTLMEYLFNSDYGIDQLLFPDPDGIVGHFPPGRLAPVTAVCFVLVGISFLLDFVRKNPWPAVSQVFVGIVLFTSSQALMATALGINYLFGLAFHTRMAIATSIGLILLCLGKLASASDASFMKRLSSETPTSILARRLLLASFLTPILVCWIGQLGIRNRVYDQDFAQLIQIVCTTGILIVIVLIATNSLFQNELKRSVQARDLRTSEERFRKLVEITAEVVWTAAPNGLIVDDSPSWRTFTGQTFDQWKTTGWLDAIHPEDQAQAVAAWKKAVDNLQPYETEYRVRKANAEWCWTQARAMPLLNGDQTVREWIGMNSNIHDRKLDELALRTAKETAEKANSAKTQFLANMSHEIRTPVGAIIGFIDLLRKPQIEPETKAQHLEIVHRNANSLLHLVDDILDLSKVEAGKISIEYANVWLMDLIAEVGSSMTMRSKEKGIGFQIKFDGLIPDKIETDRLRLRQILINILGNAIKFTSEGSVSLTVQYREPHLFFSVVDTGVGITLEQQERLFQAFSQADPSMTRKFGGTGLGLILSKKLAEELGGDLFLARSETGAGSEFVASIQAKLGNDSTLTDLHSVSLKPETKTIASEEQPALEGLNVLLVEDSIDNQILIQTYLRKSGAVVSLADNGLIGVEKAMATMPDVVLMDVQMAIMDGRVATRKLRSLGFSKPIIALTAHAMREERDKCFESGCTDYLTKPIDRTHLIEVLSQYVAKPEVKRAT